MYQILRLLPRTILNKSLSQVPHLNKLFLKIMLESELSLLKTNYEAPKSTSKKRVSNS